MTQVVRLPSPKNSSLQFNNGIEILSKSLGELSRQYCFRIKTRPIETMRKITKNVYIHGKIKDMNKEQWVAVVRRRQNGRPDPFSTLETKKLLLRRTYWSGNRDAGLCVCTTASLAVYGIGISSAKVRGGDTRSVGSLMDDVIESHDDDVKD